MLKFHIQYFIVALLLSLGVFTLFNYDLPMKEWSTSSMVGTIILSLIIYHNTVQKHDQNPNGSV